MPVLDSEALIAVHYNDQRRELRATFQPRARTYVYFGVPRRTYDALLAADSRGAFFNKHIRDRYAFREVRR
jgi:hypothetical protein